MAARALASRAMQCGRRCSSGSSRRSSSGWSADGDLEQGHAGRDRGIGAVHAERHHAPRHRRTHLAAAELLLGSGDARQQPLRLLLQLTGTLLEGSEHGPAVPSALRPRRVRRRPPTSASWRFAVSAWALRAAIWRSSAAVSSVTMRSPACTLAPSRTCTRATMPPLGDATGSVGSRTAPHRQGREVAEPGECRARRDTRRRAGWR